MVGEHGAKVRVEQGMENTVAETQVKATMAGEVTAMATTVATMEDMAMAEVETKVV